MSATSDCPDCGTTRDEITIEPRHDYGARVFINQAGGITVEQTTDYAGPAQLVLTTDEAFLLAEALAELAGVAWLGKPEMEAQHGAS